MQLALKHRAPYFLVVTSMILLFLFVGYWNFSSYMREKNKLADDVEIQLQLAYAEVRDSELMYFIQTQLTNENGENFADSISIFLNKNPMFPNIPEELIGNDKAKKDSLYDSDPTIILDFDYAQSNDTFITNNLEGHELTVIAKSKINSAYKDTLHPHQDSTLIDFSFKKLEFPDRAYRVTKDYRLSYGSDSITNWNSLNDSVPTRLEIFNSNSDTILPALRFISNGSNVPNSVDKTYGLLKENLIKNNLPSQFVVIPNPTQEEEGLRVNYKTDGFSFTDWTVDLTDYQYYIIKRMFPTLFFSLFLLGIISLAFWTLLTNWIKQNRLVKVKNEFINNMTHELKTPIATVGVALEAISNFDLSKDHDTTKEYIDISRNEVNRLSQLVDKVLNIAAFDSNTTALNTKPINLATIIEDMVKSMQLHLKDKKATIDFHNQVNNPVIDGDELHLSNVVYNMVDNALKYCSNDPKIKIAIQENSDSFVLTFADNGHGIPKEYQSKIFDRFFRVPTDDKHDIKGHGLGLNYVQNIIHEHGGTIALESKINEGSTFTITLPKTGSYV